MISPVAIYNRFLLEKLETNAHQSTKNYGEARSFCNPRRRHLFRVHHFRKNDK
jgi:hypothetical protein